MNKNNIFEINNSNNKKDNSLILPTNNPFNDIVRMSIKRLTTKDGKCKADENLKIGQEFLVDQSSISGIEVENEAGISQQIIVNVVNENGKVLGWMFAHFFWGE